MKYLNSYENTLDSLSWNGFALINLKQIIHGVCSVAQTYATTPETNVISQYACQAFEELTGCEQALTDILAGDLPFLEFNLINRPTIAGQTEYLDLRIVPINPDAPSEGMLLLIKQSGISG